MSLWFILKSIMSKIIVEYSESQKCFHISTEEEWAGNVFKTAEAEKRNPKWKSDWMIVGEFNSYEEAKKFTKQRRENGTPTFY